MKSNFKKAAIGLTVTGVLAAAAYAGFSALNGNDNETVSIDAMAKAAATVNANLQKPCAMNAAQISAVLLSDPNLECDGPRVASPSIK